MNVPDGMIGCLFKFCVLFVGKYIEEICLYLECQIEDEECICMCTCVFVVNVKQKEKQLER